MGTDLQDDPPPVPLGLLLPDGRSVVVDGRVQIGAATDNDIVLTDDRCVSRRHCVVERLASGRVVIRDLGSSNGTWVNGARVESAEVRPGAWLTIGTKRILAASLVETSTILGTSSATLRLRSEIERVAALPSSVLIEGETGTGKDLVAQALHTQSGRTGEYVAVNCGAIAPALIESFLFGHEAGSFTGAAARQPGVFEQAHRGTLFLDEIGELATALQTRLLRALEGTIRPVGAQRDLHVDVRVVAATNVDLSLEVKAGRFRSDLYFRLNQHAIQVLPLRHPDRQADIEVLARRFLEEIDGSARLSVEALERLRGYGWPGNVRELRSCIARTLVMTHTPGDIPAGDVAFDNGSADKRRRLPASVNLDGRKYVDVEREILEKALRHHRGNIRLAAAALGIPKSTLHDRIRRHGLQIKKER
jgi:transcriptional regulator with PAS, ATPase and Fis domain